MAPVSVSLESLRHAIESKAQTRPGFSNIPAISPKQLASHTRTRVHRMFPEFASAVAGAELDEEAIDGDQVVAATDG